MEGMDITALIESVQALAVEFAVNVLAALAIFIVGRWAAKLAHRLTHRALQRMGTDALVIRFAANMVKILVLAAALLAAVNQLGVQTASLIALLGAAGLAVGLALQGSLAHFAAGVLIMSFRPYRIGDYVEGAGVSGTVDDLQLFTTVLITPDNRRVIVPNGQMMGGTITNHSAMPTRRVDLVLSVDYAADTEAVRTVLTELVDADSRILRDPAPFIRMTAHGDSAVEWTIRAWATTQDQWPVYWDLIEESKRRLDAAGIAIPFPQREIHLVQHSGTDQA